VDNVYLKAASALGETPRALGGSFNPHHDRLGHLGDRFCVMGLGGRPAGLEKIRQCPSSSGGATGSRRAATGAGGRLIKVIDWDD